jgi:hypothetical protein
MEHDGDSRPIARPDTTSGSLPPCTSTIIRSAVIFDCAGNAIKNVPLNVHVDCTFPFKRP